MKLEKSRLGIPVCIGTQVRCRSKQGAQGLRMKPFIHRHFYAQALPGAV